MRRLHGICSAACAALLCVGAAALALEPGFAVGPPPPAASAALPVAAVRSVTDTYFGVPVADPYRYFEDTKNPEVAAWMRAHSDRAHAVLAALPERAAWRARIEALERDRAEAVMRVQRSNDGRLFYLHRGPSDDQYRLMVRAPNAAQGRVLYDPQVVARATGRPHAVTAFRPSPNGQHVGVVVSADGSEAGVLQVFETATGRALIEPIDRADFALPAWVDEHRFLIQRLQAPAAGAAPVDKYRYTQVEDIRLPSAQGGATHTKLPVWEWKALAMTPDMEVAVRAVDGNRLALAMVFNGVQNEIALHVGAFASLHDPAAVWRKLAAFDEGITDVSVIGHTLYAVAHRDAPRSKVVAYDLRAPQRAPRLVLAPSQRVVERVVAARDALYVRVRDGNAHRVLRIAHRPGTQASEIALPLAGQVDLDSGWGRDFHHGVRDGLVIGLQDWTHARQHYRLHPDGKLDPLNLPVPGPNDAPRDYVTTEVLVRSHDGAEVPMSIVHKRGLQRDGSHPVWLTAYAAYGATLEPNFQRARLAWLERGGVLAFANPRGSGVYGQAWYLAGKGPTKPNSWLDAIACAEYLVRERWTAPQRLAFFGRSAGGLLAGRVLTERPDLFGAVVIGVGALDALRLESTPNGPANVPEFGSVHTEEGFRGLLAMSPYEHVRPGTAYPAVLLTHGIHDPRVEVWTSTKMAARLMAASASGHPVLLRLDYGAGHGIGNTATQQMDEAADTYAFLWDRLAGRR